MLTSTRARAEDVRALAGAIALGSGAGLLIGAAYLAGDHAGHALPASHPTGEAIAQAGSSPSGSLRPPAGPMGASAADLRDRFRFAGDLTRVVARPFQFRQVANAPSDLNCLAEAVYFEARGEAADGQKAVAQVVLNRVRHPAFPKTICAVVHQHSGAGCQFTFACSPRQAALDSSAWRRARDIASAALHGAVMTAVGDATHFQSARSGPFAGLLRVAQVGAHVFYRFGGPEGSAAMFRQTPSPSPQPVRIEMARLDTASETASGLGREAAKTALAPPSAPALAPPAAIPASLLSKPPELKLPSPPIPAATVAKPPAVAAGAQASDTTAKPRVSLALTQS